MRAMPPPVPTSAPTPATAPTESPETILQRLNAATVAYRDAVEVFERHRDVWQTTITAAVDAGIQNKVIAHRAGIAPSRVCAIVARVYSLPPAA